MAAPDDQHGNSDQIVVAEDEGTTEGVLPQREQLQQEQQDQEQGQEEGGSEQPEQQQAEKGEGLEVGGDKGVGVPSMLGTQEVDNGDSDGERTEISEDGENGVGGVDAPAAEVEASGDAEAIKTIQKLLLMTPVDVKKLRNLAWEDGGYQTDEMRRKVWPELLCLDGHGLGDFRQLLETPHSMTEQIQRDVDRSLTHFSHVRKWKRQRQQSKREKLRDVINAIVRKYDGVLNYFQGYHDVVTMILLVTSDTQLTYALTERVSLYFFRDCMRADFGVLMYLLHLLPVIIQEFDPELGVFISQSKVEPYFCMAWVLTWFAHDLKDINTVSRLYDVLLGAHPTLILYICAAVTICARRKILECECEFAAVHNTLSHAAKGIEDWEAVLHKTKEMFIKCPPHELIQRAPAYIKEPLRAGGVTALEFPPPWFTGTSLPDWISLEQSREEEGKKRIGKAARQWRRAARLAGAENPDEMLAAYIQGGRHAHPSGVLKRFLSRIRTRKWKIAPSPAALISTAVLIGAVSYSYHLSSRQHHVFPF